MSDEVKTSSINISITPAQVGVALVLDESSIDTGFTHWSVQDAFNGKTLPKQIGEPIHGMFLPNNHVDLYLFKDTKLAKTVKNVRLRRG